MELDAVEIKLNVDAAQIDKALAVFGFDAGAGKPRRIWFGEIIDGQDGPGALPLLARGVILRLRAKKNGGDLTLKLRGPDGGIDVAEWHAGPGKTAGARIEGDWAGRRQVSASLVHDLDAVVDQPTIAGLLSPEQQDLAAAMVVPWRRARLLGPIQARKWDATAEGVEAERWEVDGLRFLEISIRVEDDPDGAMTRLQQRATAGGLDIGAAGQETKTTTVLRHLATR